MTPPKPEQPSTPQRVAIVIVTCNQRDALIRCLASLGDKHARIVVDSGSGDTVGITDQYPGVRFINLPRHFGLTKALNLGVRAAEAEFVLFLSPEVEITPEAVDLLADTLQEQNPVGAVSPRLLLPDGTPAAQARNLPNATHPDPPFHAAQPGETVPATGLQAVMFRLFFLRALREIDERYGEYGSAIELSQQVKRANKTILIHPQATAIWHAAEIKFTTAEQSDREVGTAKFLSKHYGMVTGWTYWLGRVFTALFSFRFGKLVNIVSWTKIDGN